MTNTFGITARAYRWYADDGAENASTALAAENTAYDLYAGVNASIVLRYGVQESGTGTASGAATDDYQLQYKKNAGAFTNVTGASSNIRARASANLTDGAATTQRLSAGSGSFVAGEIDEGDGLITDWALTANNYSDLVYSLEVVAADVAEDDSFTFQVLRNGSVFNTYSVTPTLTVTKVNNVTAVTLSATPTLPQAVVAPESYFAITAANRGEANGGTTAATSIAVSPTATLPVGALVVAFVSRSRGGVVDGAISDATVADNSSQSGAANTWTLIRGHNEQAANSGFIFASVLTRSILTSDTVTASWTGNEGDRLIALSEFAVDGPVDLVPTNGQNAVDSAITNPIEVTTGTLASPAGLWLAYHSSEGGTDVTITPDADYAQLHNHSTGGTSGSDGRGYAAYRIADLTSDTFGISLSAGRQNTTILVAIQAAGGAITAATFTVAVSLPQASVDHSLTGATLSATPTLPQANVTHQPTAATLIATPSLPQASLEHRLAAVTLSATPTLPQAAVQADQTVTAVTLTTTPELPQASITVALTAQTLEVGPLLDAATLRADIDAATLTVSPTLPTAEIQSAAANVTAVTLTTTPSLPTAELVHSLTAVTLETTPSLPAATLSTSLTAVTLGATPSLPQASVDHSITAVTLEAAPSLPAATLTTENTVTAVTLTVTPTFPQASAQVASVFAVTYDNRSYFEEYQEGYESYILRATVAVGAITAATLTVTPSLPQASVQVASLAAQTLTATPTLPAATLAATVTAATLTATPSLPAAELRFHTTLHPDGDISLNGWTDQAGGTTDIWQAIDELTADDDDYVRSPLGPASEIYTFHLSDAVDPSVSGGHIIRYRYHKEDAIGTVSLTVRLLDGASEIAEWVHSDITDTVTEASQTLTDAQADSITDYTDLRVELEASQV